jgi:hypothetical protein
MASVPCLLGAVLVVVPICARAQTPASGETPAATAAFTADAARADEGGARGFFRDVGRDYLHMFSIENAEWATVGAVATMIVQTQDDELHSVTAGPTPYALKPGAPYGNLTFQLPLACAWWIAGHASGRGRAASAGRDLVRAQISAVSWTYAIKYAVDRMRPNGDPRSFPSGHTSATFATAMVLQEHYGWKLGVPTFAVATYTAAERVYDNKHWASDVAFGALVGVLSGRTVTLHLRRTRVALQAMPVPGGGGVTIHVRR